MIPKRRKRQRSGIRDDDGPLRCSAHLAWIRGFRCHVDAPDCSGRIEAAHVRTGTDGGMGLKPGDQWTIPLCSDCHREQHQWGEPEFERRKHINMRKAAEYYAARSPALRRYRMRKDD